MASKYDFFWSRKIKDISVLLDKAYYGHQGHSLDVSGIKNLGKRGNWYGVVDVCRNNVSKGEMAHAKSLGRVIVESNILKAYDGCCFTLMISTDCKLSAKKSPLVKENHAELIKPIATWDRKVIPKKDNKRVNCLIEILSDIPWEVWYKTIEKVPGSYYMKPLIDFTVKAKIIDSKDADLIRNVWHIILQGINEKNSKVTMLHLGSLICQIYALDNEGIIRYFDDIGVPETGNKLNAYLKGEFGGKKPIINNDRVFSQADNSTNEKIICFVPCCKSKFATGDTVEPMKSLSIEDLPQTWEQLSYGRQKMQYCIDHGSDETSALTLYTGYFYKPLNKNEVYDAIFEGKLTLIIISAGYGIINALEPINNYDEILNGKVARIWRDNGLANVIAEYLLHQKPNKIYGFFAGEEYWPYSSSAYRYFYTEGVRKSMENGLKVDLAGCFYRESGSGTSNILKALGSVFNNFLSLNFDQDYLEKIEQQGLIMDNIQVGFRKI